MKRIYWVFITVFMSSLFIANWFWFTNENNDSRAGLKKEKVIGVVKHGNISRLVPMPPIKKTSVKDNKIGATSIDKAPIHSVPTTLPKDSGNNRQNYFNKLTQTSSDAILQEWIGSLGTPNLEMISYALAYRLQNHNDSGNVYGQLQELLGSGSYSQKGAALNLLTNISTPQSLQILLDEILLTQATEFRKIMLSRILQIGDNRWGGKFHPELSKPLEKAWNIESSDRKLLVTVARTIAKVGSPSGVELLLSTIDSSGMTVSDIKSGSYPKAWAALKAMEDIRNPALIPVLSRRFSSYQVDNPSFVASGDALAIIGQYETTKMLLDWAKQASQEAIPLVEQWFGLLRTEPAIKLATKVLAYNEPFQDMQVRKAIEKAVEKTKPIEGK